MAKRKIETELQQESEIKQAKLYETEKLLRDYQFRDSKGNTFIRAAREQDVNTMLELLQKPEEWIHTTASNGSTVLHAVVKGGCVEAVKFLLDLDIVDREFLEIENENDKSTALDAAVDGGYVEVIKLLIEKDHWFPCENNPYGILYTRACYAMMFEDRICLPYIKAKEKRLVTTKKYLLTNGSQNLEISEELLEYGQQDLPADEEKYIEPAGASADNDSAE